MAIEFSCPHCGHHTNVAPQYAGQTGPCGQCGQTITIPGPTPSRPYTHTDLGDNAGVRMLLPVGRSVWAIVAGYAGLLSLIPIFAPIAIITGIIAIIDIRHHPNKHGMGRAIFGLVMGLLVVGGLFTLFFVGAMQELK